MRHRSFAATGFMLAVLLAPFTAHAAGNVLLPPADNSANAPQPNLGISVQTPSPSVTAGASPAAPPVPTVPSAALLSAPQQTQAPPVSPNTLSPLPLPNAITTLDPAIAAKLPRGAMPTTIIHLPDTSTSTAQTNGTLPNSLTIAVGNTSIFGVKDATNITKILGLNRDQISSACLLTIGGLLQTDKGSYVLNGGTATQYPVQYDGMIKSYMMVGNALCNATNIPPGSGFVTETGGRYIVPLQQVKCDPPTRQVSSLTITYDGSGTSKCVYQ